MGTNCNSELRVVNEDGFLILWLKSGCLAEDERYHQLNRASLHGVGLSAAQGFDSPNIAFLRDWGLEGLLVSEIKADLKPIQELHGLRMLSLSNPRPVNLRNLSRLQHLWLACHRRTVLPDSLGSLRECSLSGYSPPDGTLAQLGDAVELGRLELTEGKVRSLAGVPGAVSRLDLFRLPTLWSIDGLPAALRELRITGCKLIPDFRPIARCRGLRVLVLADCGKIASFKFLRELEELERVVLTGDTSVEDGDMHPLIGVETAIFDDRRGYNLTMDEVRSLKDTSRRG